MTDPLVVAICLTRDRPVMTRRAVAAFHAMPYQPMRLLILDTSVKSDEALFMERHRVSYRHQPDFQGKSIGELRNEANDWACEFDPEIIAHLDSDDVSHANRISEQVTLLDASGAECVGYNEAVFWDTRLVNGDLKRQPSYAAYVYRNYSPDYCIGSSMMYTRAAWQRVKFDHINQDEDGRFLQRVKSLGVSGIYQNRHVPELLQGVVVPNGCEPRMICSIHGGNTSHYNPEGERNSYTRAPEWDQYCERIMKL